MTSRIVASLACGSLFAIASATNAAFEVKAVPLTAEKRIVTLDYFAWDSASGRLWVPAGNQASVIVLDRDGAIAGTIPGFPTAEFELRGRKGRLGPSSVALGRGVAYVGNRADRSICIIDAATLKRGACQVIGTTAQGWAVAPDAVVYVGATRELWVTRGAPPIGIASSDKALTIFDASDPKKLKQKSKVALGASAEGYAVDNPRGMFDTNLEESGETVAIDVRKRKIVGRWKSGCDETQGVAVDRERGFVFVACSSRVVALDANHGGAVLGSIDTGDGLDNIDYSDSEHLLYAAASVAATLTVARVGDKGDFGSVAVVPTAKGARSVVAGEKRAYVIDPIDGQILFVTQTNP